MQISDLYKKLIQQLKQKSPYIETTGFQNTNENVLTKVTTQL